MRTTVIKSSNKISNRIAIQPTTTYNIVIAEHIIKKVIAETAAKVVIILTLMIMRMGRLKSQVIIVMVLLNGEH